MGKPVQQIIHWPTPKGRVEIRSNCTPEDLSGLSLGLAIRTYACYNPIVPNIDMLVKMASDPDGNVTIARVTDDIVGWAVLRNPDPEERWVHVGDGIMMEVSVIEVSQPWRSMGISTRLLRCLVDHPRVEERILYMVGYSWTWDLDCSGLSPMEYRQMMINLFSREKFRTFQTNEPNVMLRPENLFMARIGSRISDDLVERFKRVRFNLQ